MIRVSKLSILLFVSVVLCSVMVHAADAENGKKLMLTKKKGNCLACHKLAGAEQPGNMGPELIDLKTKYPTDEALRLQVWDATRANPISSMPPFGRNQILTEKEINDVVAFLKTL